MSSNNALYGTDITFTDITFRHITFTKIETNRSLIYVMFLAKERNYIFF